jgi:putative ABC transport system substrate-binding protein
LDRRAFLGTLAGGLLSAPLAANAQPVRKMARIGVLVPVEPESPREPNIRAFRQGLRDLGYVEDQNIAVDYRYALGKSQLYAELVMQLVRQDPDVLVIGSVRPTLAAKQITQTIPIVGVGMGDPVRNGIVRSLARPSGNITGSAWGVQVTKLVQVLKEADPGVLHIGYLRDADTPPNAPFLAEAQVAAQRMGMEVRPLDVISLQEIQTALAQMSKERDAAPILGGGLFTISVASDITRLAAKYKLPAVYADPGFMDSGGLMCYSPSLPDLWRRAAVYADKILKGAKPADVPVEQPTKFELVINLKTAKALGLTIPPSLLLRADQVIE